MTKSTKMKRNYFTKKEINKKNETKRNAISDWTGKDGTRMVLGTVIRKSRLNSRAIIGYDRLRHICISTTNWTSFEDPW